MSESNDLTAASIFDLTGSIALVTGGGTGIGLMIAKGLAANGATVYIGARRVDVVSKAAEENKFQSGKLIALELDVTNKESIQKAVKLISQKEGKLDILINNAGKVGPRTTAFSTPGQSPETLGSRMFDAESFEEWADVWQTDVSSIFFVTMAFLGLLDKSEGGGAVVNIGSISGVMKLSQEHFAYNAAKAAVHHLTQMLSTEFALKGGWRSQCPPLSLQSALGYTIRVNAIAPGLFQSEMAPGSSDKPFDEQVDQMTRTLHPLPSKRAGRGVDIVATTLYLVGKGGRYVNGQILVVDGGFVAVNP